MVCLSDTYGTWYHTWYIDTGHLCYSWYDKGSVCLHTPGVLFPYLLWCMSACVVHKTIISHQIPDEISYPRVYFGVAPGTIPYQCHHTYLVRMYLVRMYDVFVNVWCSIGYNNERIGYLRYYLPGVIWSREVVFFSFLRMDGRRMERWATDNA